MAEQATNMFQMRYRPLRPALRKLSLTLFGILVVSGILGCSNSQAPVSQSQESDAASATLAYLDQQYGFVNNRPLRLLLKRVTGRLASAAYGTALETEIGDVDANQFRNYPWQVYVLNTKKPNSFSLGGGVIVLTLGILYETETEAELASVLSHEMAHQILGHTQEALLETSKHEQSAPQASFTLEHELEADTLGLKILHVARYDMRHATHALSIAYRPISGFVPGIPPKWLVLRMANLEQELYAHGSKLPATENSREFNKVRRRLF